ncbi:sugar transferase [Paenibacillus segetis]|uniref:Sugar transferase n=1 Tax=Paenibacillus segetis TaxID=1325360 RepID=A0ABQ1YPR0_9BACL|nr:sugar transferase [Paenibacillus segetis]GGH32227.1 sugar transferase [Paenibacillus segetis]
MIKLIRFSGSKVFVLFLDCLFIYVSYLLAYNIKFKGMVPAQQWDSFFYYGPWLGLLTAITYYFFNLYDFAGRQKPMKWLSNLMLAHLIFVVELIVLHYWLKTFTLPRSVVIIAFIIQIALTFTLRLLLFFVQTKGIGKKRALLVVNGHASSVKTLEKLRDQGGIWFDIQRVLLVSNDHHQELSVTSWDGIDILVLGHEIPAVVKTGLIRSAGQRNIEVLMIPDFYELYLMKAELQQIDDLMVYSMMPPELTLWERFAKRGIDLVISILLLIITSPVLLLMLIVIPATSSGKALFVQERVGLHEKIFKVLKFRSMVDNAEKSTGPILASATDSRITRLGKFIRATRIDELPQLLNVIRGDMSLVGPRPEREFFVAQFKEELPHYTYRLMVKPGVTGLAQVMANYTTSPSDKLRYDMMYIKNYSPLLDLKILFQTILVVLQRDQSKGLDPATSETEVSIEKYLQQSQLEIAAVKESY